MDEVQKHDSLKVQTVEAQSTDSESISHNKFEKSLPNDEKVLKKEYNEVTNEECYEGQNFFLL
jgi:hypothetical protein